MYPNFYMASVKFIPWGFVSLDAAAMQLYLPEEYGIGSDFVYFRNQRSLAGG